MERERERGRFFMYTLNELKVNSYTSLSLKANAS
jgi:hypothetical protein